MSDYLSKISAARGVIRGVSDHLSVLAHALDVAGNERLANTMQALADQAYDAQKAIDDAVGAEISDRYRQTTNEVGGILKAALDHATGSQSK